MKESASPVVCVVDDRVFLLGVDQLYRRAMKKHERGELRACASQVCELLNLAPANVPIEGYYTEHPELTEYFRLIRALQVVAISQRARVESHPAFARLIAVTSSPLFGEPAWESGLLPRGNDPLYYALNGMAPSEWSVTELTQRARAITRDGDDFSLVGLAAFAGDAVLLGALRETAVLYSNMARGVYQQPEEVYEWRVDPELTQRAVRFVATFNELFSDHLPIPAAESARQFWKAAEHSHIEGRCVRIGLDGGSEPPRHYHWGIVGDPMGALRVHEFWDREIWTTERFEHHVYAGKPLP